MRLTFIEVAGRLTGFSTPLFGVQWTPPPLDMDVARRLLAYLEDRRALYNPAELEIPTYVSASVLDIRQRLTDALGQVDRSGPLGQSVLAMRAACRQFLDRARLMPSDAGFYHDLGMSQQWVFVSALGELRGVIGVHEALIAVRHGIDVEAQLASILPPQTKEEDI